MRVGVRSQRIGRQVLLKGDDLCDEAGLCRGCPADGYLYGKGGGFQRGVPFCPDHLGAACRHHDLRSKMPSLTHQNLPLSIFLETPDLGYPAWGGTTSGKVSDSDILSALGIGIVSYKDVPEAELQAPDYGILGAEIPPDRLDACAGVPAADDAGECSARFGIAVASIGGQGRTRTVL